MLIHGGQCTEVSHGNLYLLLNFFALESFVYFKNHTHM